VPDIIKLTKIAQYFNVSADFLLGLSEVESPDANARSAVEYTGLTEAAVERLHIGIDTFECDSVGASESEKQKKLPLHQS
jgi:transcriptional regulator with XRE-family HTH domain